MIHVTAALGGRLSAVPWPAGSCSSHGRSSSRHKGEHHKQGPLVESRLPCFDGNNRGPQFEWAQALLYLLGTEEVFTGQRGPAFHSCLMWTFLTII